MSATSIAETALRQKQSGDVLTPPPLSKRTQERAQLCAPGRDIQPHPIRRGYTFHPLLLQAYAVECQEIDVADSLASVGGDLFCVISTGFRVVSVVRFP